MNHSHLQQSQGGGGEQSYYAKASSPGNTSDMDRNPYNWFQAENEAAYAEHSAAVAMEHQRRQEEEEKEEEGIAEYEDARAGGQNGTNAEDERQQKKDKGSATNKNPTETEAAASSGGSPSPQRGLGHVSSSSAPKVDDHVLTVNDMLEEYRRSNSRRSNTNTTHASSASPHSQRHYSELCNLRVSPLRKSMRFDIGDHRLSASTHQQSWSTSSQSPPRVVANGDEDYLLDDVPPPPPPPLYPPVDSQLEMIIERGANSPWFHQPNRHQKVEVVSDSASSFDDRVAVPKGQGHFSKDDTDGSLLSQILALQKRPSPYGYASDLSKETSQPHVQRTTITLDHHALGGDDGGKGADGDTVTTFSDGPPVLATQSTAVMSESPLTTQPVAGGSGTSLRNEGNGASNSYDPTLRCTATGFVIIDPVSVERGPPASTTTRNRKAEHPSSGAMKNKNQSQSKFGAGYNPDGRPEIPPAMRRSGFGGDSEGALPETVQDEKPEAGAGKRRVEGFKPIPMEEYGTTPTTRDASGSSPPGRKRVFSPGQTMEAYHKYGDPNAGTATTTTHRNSSGGGNSTTATPTVAMRSPSPTTIGRRSGNNSKQQGEEQLQRQDPLLMAFVNHSPLVPGGKWQCLHCMFYNSSTVGSCLVCRNGRRDDNEVSPLR